jgi:hypothetical protein
MRLRLDDAPLESSAIFMQKPKPDNCEPARPARTSYNRSSMCAPAVKLTHYRLLSAMDGSPPTVIFVISR